MQINSRYEEYFAPELQLLDAQYNENEKLYNEVHKAMEKSVGRLDAKQMFGGSMSSPTKDIAQLGEVLNDIRSNQVQVAKERANIKKTIIDLDIRKENSKSQSEDANTNQLLMRNILTSIQKEAPNFTKSSQINGDIRGAEALKSIDPDAIGINANDLKMIDRFRLNKGKR